MSPCHQLGFPGEAAKQQKQAIIMWLSKQGEPK